MNSPNRLVDLSQCKCRPRRSTQRMKTTNESAPDSAAKYRPNQLRPSGALGMLGATPDTPVSQTLVNLDPARGFARLGGGGLIGGRARE